MGFQSAVCEEIQKIEEGWEGKARGLFQVLWERWFIQGTDVNKFWLYTLKGKKDQFGNYNLEYSFPYLLSSCTDFEEEETILQTMGSSMGVEVDHTPKYHCKIAGEGIEYTWAQSKKYICNILLDKKRGKENFKAFI
jgi:hypothetical protein